VFVVFVDFWNELLKSLKCNKLAYKQEKKEKKDKSTHWPILLQE